MFILEIMSEFREVCTSSRAKVRKRFEETTFYACFLQNFQNKVLFLRCKRTRRMKLIVMTTPHFFVEEHQILTALFDEGLETLHVRKPSTEAVFTERLLRLIPEIYRRNIVIHDHFHLKKEFSLRGIHLNQRNPDLPKHYRGHISCTCYNAEDAQMRKKQMDYVLLSGFYQDNTPLHEPALEELARQGFFDKKIIAQGNIGLKQIPKLRDLGVTGAVVFSDLWNRFNIYADQDYQELISHFRKLRKAFDH